MPEERQQILQLLLNANRLLKDIRAHQENQPTNNNSDNLWRTQEIAAFLALKPSSVRKYILTRKDFPAALSLPGSGGKRWNAQEVKRWAQHYLHQSHKRQNHASVSPV